MKANNEEDSKKLSPIWLVIPFGLFVILLISISVEFNNLSKPNKGTVVKVGSNTNEQNDSVKLVTQIGKTVIFKYPSYFKAIPAQVVADPTIERYNYLKVSKVAWQLNIQVDMLANGDINNYSSYTLRANNPSQYTTTTESANNKTYILSKDITSQSFNEVAFLVHGNNIATIALNGGTANDVSSMQASLISIVNNWQWIN